MFCLQGTESPTAWERSKGAVRTLSQYSHSMHMTLIVAVTVVMHDVAVLCSQDGGGEMDDDS